MLEWTKLGISLGLLNDEDIFGGQSKFLACLMRNHNYLILHLSSSKAFLSSLLNCLVAVFVVIFSV